MFPGLQSLFQFIPKVVDWGQSLCRPKSKTHLCMGLSLLQVFFLVSTGRPSAYTVVFHIMVLNVSVCLCLMIYMKFT